MGEVRALTRSLWIAVLTLVLVGVVAAGYRVTHLADATAHAEPLRQRILSRFGVSDPLMAERPAELRRYDSRFAAHPILTLGHIIPGAVFLAFAPLQFCARIRNRYRALHRWSGRVLLIAIFWSVASALYFGLLVPFGGRSEALVMGLAASVLFASAAQAFLAIRRGQVARHREWMIRLFAVAIGIATIRLVAPLPTSRLRPPASLRRPSWCCRSGLGGPSRSASRSSGSAIRERPRALRS